MDNAHFFYDYKSTNFDAHASLAYIHLKISYSVISKHLPPSGFSKPFTHMYFYISYIYHINAILMLVREPSLVTFED